MKIVYHDRYLDHIQNQGHPESPRRLQAIKDRLKEEGLWNNVITPGPATTDQVKSVHTPQYISYLENFGEGYLDPDTYSREETFEIALLAAGGALEAARLMWENKETVFALPRPPGHHAESGSSGGFCYINNIAVAAKSIVPRAKRVAVIDIDVHHGNGTNEMFHKTDEVFYSSTHQYGIFPGTGSIQDVGYADGEGFTMNIPLTWKMGDSTFYSAYRDIIFPAIRQYKPGAILVSIGGDAHYMDPLAGLTLSTAGYLELVKEMMDLAGDLCQGRIGFYLEGGYDVDVLAEIMAGAVGLSVGKKVSTKHNKVYDDSVMGSDIIRSAEAIQGEYWDLSL